MTNKHRGEFEFTAAGRSYTLQFTQDSLVQLEDQLDLGIIAIMKRMEDWATDPTRVRLKWVRALLWAGLRKHHPDIDIVAAGELITAAGGVGDVTNAIGEALGRAFGGEARDDHPLREAAAEPPRVNGIGLGSTSNSLASDSPPAISGTSRLAN